MRAGQRRAHDAGTWPKAPPAMTHQLINLASQQGFQCLAITTQVRSFLRQHGGREGAVVVSGQHTTTAVIIMKAKRAAAAAGVRATPEVRVGVEAKATAGVTATVIRLTL